MEVKCPKCKLRYEATVAAGINQLACVCPRCGTPFTFDVPAAESAANRAQETDEAPVATPPPTPQTVQQQTTIDPETHSQTTENAHPQSPAATRKSTYQTQRTLEPEPPHSRRSCLKNALIVCAALIALDFFLARACQNHESYQQPSEEEAQKNELIGTSNTTANLGPEWLQGSWRAETDYGPVTLTIRKNHIAETHAGEQRSGNFTYRSGKLYCDFGDHGQFVYRVDLKNGLIDIGQGIIMSKREE